MSRKRILEKVQQVREQYESKAIKKSYFDYIMEHYYNLLKEAI